MPTASFPVVSGDLVDAAWLNASGKRVLFDSNDAKQAVVFPLASLTIANIPQTYKHLELVLTAREDGAVSGDYVNMRINGSAGAAYYQCRVLASATTVSSAEDLAGTSMKVGYCLGASAGVHDFSISSIVIPNYVGAATFAYPHFVSQTGQWVGALTGNGTVATFSGYNGNSNAAVTSITLLPGTGNFVAPSRFTLYGVV